MVCYILVNLLFLFGILASLGAVLTLPGIAGIVLTMGTAVDANIIIYERAKEELRAGKSLDELKSPIVDRSNAFYRRCKRYAYLDWCRAVYLVQDH
jgi:preprotein translocase subunit SecF